MPRRPYWGLADGYHTQPHFWRAGWVNAVRILAELGHCKSALARDWDTVHDVYTYVISADMDAILTDLEGTLD